MVSAAQANSAHEQQKSNKREILIPELIFIERHPSVRRSISCQNSRWSCAKHDAGFNFESLPVPFVRPELPLLQGIADHLLLVRIRAQKVDVPDLACFIDNDPQ